MLTLLTAKQTFKHVKCNRRHRRISSVRSPLAFIEAGEGRGESTAKIKPPIPRTLANHQMGCRCRRVIDTHVPDGEMLD